MGRVLTNNVTIAYARCEAGSFDLPVSPAWNIIEPNDIGAFGSTITTVARQPISKNKQRRRGTVTDLDSEVEVEADAIMEHFVDFMEGFVFARFNGGTTFRPTAANDDAGGDHYVVPALGALPANTLVFARGFVNSVNNGLKVVAAASTATQIMVPNGLVDETVTATQRATVEVAGVRGAAGDLQIDASGDLISTVLDFTTLDLTLGQFIHVGGQATANRFAVTANHGFARVMGISATKLTLDKQATVFAIDNGATKSIDVLFGRFLRNVTVDDVDYLEQAFEFEATFPNLGGAGATAYEYAEGNFCNEVEFELPLADKAVCTWGFIGTDTQPPTEVRKTNAASAKQPVMTEALNSTADVARLRITDLDETGLTTDFKSVTLTIRNNVSPEKVIGTLGAKYMNSGIFEVEVEAELLFTDPDVPAAIREYREITMDFILRNDDGGIAVDIPAMSLGGGEKSFPANESVIIETTGMAYQDAELGTSIGISMFPYLPV